MALKFCRFCNAPLGVGENVPSVGDFCSDDHRRQYQEKIQRETIERLRRSEGRAPSNDPPHAPHETRSSLQPGLPPNLIPTPPLQSVSRASVSSAAVAYAIHAEVVESVTPVEVQPAPVQAALAELSKAAEPFTLPTSGPIQKTDNAALSDILRQAKGRIASDPNPQTMALALRRRPRPAAKPAAAPAVPASVPHVEAPPPPAASPAFAASAAIVSAPPPAAAMAQAAAPAPIARVRTVQIVEEPEPATEPVAPTSAAPKRVSVKPQPQATFRPAPAAPSMTASAIALDVEPPSLSFTRTDQSFFARMPWFAKLGVLLLVAGGGAGFYWQMEKSAATTRAQAKPSEDRVVPLAVLPSGWNNVPASGAEALRQGRTLTVYKPSLELADYRVEFTGEIAHRALGWVYRMTDASNYYAAKLHHNPVGKVRLSLVRWTVKDGVAGDKTWISIDGPLPSNVRYVVRIEAKGDTFTTRVQGRQVDRYNDPTHAKGGFAYANENTERGKIEVTGMSIFGKGAATAAAR